VSSTWLISRENMSTGFFAFMAAAATMARARLVLPVAGRAPMITSELGWNPPSIPSRSRNPVWRPVISPLFSYSCSRRSRPRSISWWIGIIVSVIRRSAMRNTRDSAMSTALSTSSGMS